MKIIKQFTKKKSFRQFIKFGLVGIAGTIADFSVLNLFVLVIKANVYLAASLGFAAGATNNFYWNRKWTFRHVSDKKAHIQFIQYIIVGGVGFFINLFILKICFPFFEDIFNQGSTNPLVLNFSKIIATFVVMLWNFLASKKWVFNA